MKNRISGLMLLMLLAFGGTSFASSCFQQYEDAILNCSRLPWGTRELCNLDAAADLAGCVRKVVLEA
ncbi:MAG TPA: hypothetical protein VF618_19085 [Thermoanaerobaculia bacterium]